MKISTSARRGIRSASLESQTLPVRNFGCGSSEFPFFVLMRLMRSSSRSACLSTPATKSVRPPSDSISTKNGDSPGNTTTPTLSPAFSGWLRMNIIAENKSRAGETSTGFQRSSSGPSVHPRLVRKFPSDPSTAVSKVRRRYFSNCSEPTVSKSGSALSASSVASSW